MVGALQDPLSLPFNPPSSIDKPGLPLRFQRVKRLERPNKTALDEQIAKIHEEIDGLQARVFEINTIIDNKQQNKHVASQELLDARNRLSELNASFRVEVDEKRALREELDMADKMRERMRSDARSLREKLPYVRVEQIDEEIRKLEYRMSHTSLSLQEEKRLVSQVEGFKKSREFVRNYNERMDQISQDEGSRAELLDKIKEKDQRLNGLKAQQEEQRRILAEIREKEASQALDIPTLIQERSSNIEKIKALREEVKELKAEFRVKEDEFWEREREWKSQQAFERKFKAEKREAEWKEREKLRKQRAMENFVEPFTDEIILCDQLISYMQKFAPVEDVQAATSHKVELVTPKGFGDVITSKKNRTDDDLEGWFGGFGGKGKTKKTKIPTPSKTRERERLCLSLDALTSFEKVKLPPPTTVGDVSKSVEELRVKKESFLQLQKQAREKANVETQTAGTNESNGGVLETGKTAVETEEVDAESESNEVRTLEAEADEEAEEGAVSESTQENVEREDLPEEEILSTVENEIIDPEALEPEECGIKAPLDTSSTDV